MGGLRLLISDRGSVNLMGYWSEGRALDDTPVRGGQAQRKPAKSLTWRVIFWVRG
jgi:hypothetical protein